MTTRKSTITQILAALLCWMALGFSLGWYYTITYYGRSGWPLPVPEGLGGLILYYFSVQNMPTPWQAVHWMIVFPLAGVVWVALLRMTAPYFGRPCPGLSRSLLLFALVTVPLSLPGPVLAVMAGSTNDGWSATRMISVALRRGGFGVPPAWLSPLYLALAIVVLIGHLAVYRLLFAAAFRDAWPHYLVTAILFVFVVAGMGAIAAMPLAIATTGDIPMPAGL